MDPLYMSGHKNGVSVDVTSCLVNTGAWIVLFANLVNVGSDQQGCQTLFQVEGPSGLPVKAAEIMRPNS